MAKHTPGPWRIGTSGGSVVCDTPVRAGPKTSEDESERLYYGGYLVAESIAPQNRPLIAAAPDLLKACERIADEKFLTQAGAAQLVAAIAKARGDGADNA